MIDSLKSVFILVPLTLALWLGMFVFFNREKDTPDRVDVPEQKTQPEMAAAHSGQDKAAAEQDLVRTEPARQGEEQADAQVEHALTVTYGTVKQACVDESGYLVPAEILFRADSAAIKALSLARLDELIAMYHSCDQGIMLISDEAGSEQPDKALHRRRLDEVRYHLIHMRVNKTDIQLPEYP